MSRPARPWLYLLPAMAATSVTFLLAVISVVVGPSHGCEECGLSGASSAQTRQWLTALGVSVLALQVAWVAAGLSAVVNRANVRIRVVPLIIVILFALGPVISAGIAVGLSIASNANPAGSRN